jgi:hypothetical protein
MVCRIMGCCNSNTTDDWSNVVDLGKKARADTGANMNQKNI